MTAPSIPPGPQAAIIAFAIRFRGVIAALALVLIASGVISLIGASYDVFPEFAPPQVDIQTEAPGLTPEQVEVLVTRPIESAINGAPGVRTIRSNSSYGLSVVTVFFAPSADTYRNRQMVAERLSIAAQQMPQGTAAPTMTPLTSSAQMLLCIGLTSDTRSLMTLRSVAENVVKPRLLAVPGVADIPVFGGERPSIQVQVHPDQLVRLNLGMNDVTEAARRAAGVRAAGFVETPNQRIAFQTRAQAPTPDDIARTAITRDGGPLVTLGDVADVRAAPEPAVGGATIQGQPGVVLNISEQFGANTLKVTKAVEAALAELRPTLQAEGITLHPDLFRPADFITTATDNIGTSLLIGGVLVIAVLFLFLFDLRTAAISCIAIPLSLLAGTLALQALGFSLNTMTLGGLAIAIGEVVDDAVIDVENIVRRLRENRRLAAPRPESRVILDACLEVRGAVVYATFAIILVFLPVLALGGIAGRLFSPLALAYILAVLASLGCALLVTPALSALLLAGRPLRQRDPPAMRWSRGAYETLLRRLALHPRMVMGAALLVTGLGCAALPFFGANFIPDLKEGHFTLHMSAVPGTSLAESLRLGTLVSERLRKLPLVRSIAQRAGRAELSADTWGTHYSEFEVDLRPNLSGDETDAGEAAIRRALADFVGVNFALKTFLSERIEETVSGFAAAVAVNIYGNDLDTLDRMAADVAHVLAGIRGAADVQVASPPGLPQLAISLRRLDLARLGLDAMDVLDVVRAAYQGDVAGQVFEGNHPISLITILDPASRNSLARVGALPLRARDGTQVRLSQVADIWEATGREQVLHQGGQRLQSVTLNVVGRDTASFMAEARHRIEREVTLPAETYIDYGGGDVARAQAQRDLLIKALAAGIGVVLMLSVVTRGWRNLLLVMANLPFALVGGVIAVFATGGLLTLGSTVGFVTLFGITLRNSIMMISHYEHLVTAEGMEWGLEAAIRGAGDRLTPVLMTSLVTGLGLLPLAIGMNDPGREIEGPMAVVILGGLFTSLALNLLVLPTLALRFGRFTPARDEFAAEVVHSDLHVGA